MNPNSSINRFLKKHNWKGQRILFPVIVVALLVFLLAVSTLPFNRGLFSILFRKPSSHAQSLTSDEIFSVYTTPKMISDFNNPLPSIKSFYDHYQAMMQSHQEQIVVFGIGSGDEVYSYPQNALNPTITTQDIFNGSPLSFEAPTSGQYNDAQATLDTSNEFNNQPSYRVDNISPTGAQVVDTNLNIPLSQFPTISWEWKKNGGKRIGIQFQVTNKDDDKSEWVSYGAGNISITDEAQVQQFSWSCCLVDTNVPADWTKVQVNLYQDAYREFETGVSGTVGHAFEGGDWYITAISLIPYDGSAGWYADIVASSDGGVDWARYTYDDARTPLTSTWLNQVGRVYPQNLSYSQIKNIVQAFHDEGQRRGMNVKVLDFLESDPEFSAQVWKYKMHPESISDKTSSITKGIVGATFPTLAINTYLNADNYPYAAYPNGIAQNTLTADFIVNQTTQFVNEMGYDGIYLSNSFGLNAPWNPECADGMPVSSNPCAGDYRNPDNPVKVNEVYGSQEGNIITNFYKNLKTQLGANRIIMWNPTAQTTDVEKTNYLVTQEDYQYFDILLLPTYDQNYKSQEMWNLTYGSMKPSIDSHNALQSLTNLVTNKPLKVIWSFYFLDPWYYQTPEQDFTNSWADGYGFGGDRGKILFNWWNGCENAACTTQCPSFGSDTNCYDYANELNGYLIWEPGYDGEPTSPGWMSNLIPTPSPTTSPTPPPNSQTNMLPNPVRVVDTRTNSGYEGAGQPLQGDNTPVKFSFAGKSGIPSNATAIIGNLTVVSASESGSVKVWPGDSSTEPLTPSINFDFSRPVIANSIVASLGSDGSLNVAGPNGVNIVIDVSGYMMPVSSDSQQVVYLPTPNRVIDTRTSTQSPVYGAGKTLTGYSSPQVFDVVNRTGVTTGIPSNAIGVIANVTAANAKEAGLITFWADGAQQPPTSNMNYGANQPLTTSLTMIPLGNNGQFDVVGGSGTDIIVDVLAYILPPQDNLPGQIYLLPSPIRAFDTRDNSGYLTEGAPIQGNESVAAEPVYPANLPKDASAVILNLAFTDFTNCPSGFPAYACSSTGDVIAYPVGNPIPSISSLNYSPATNLDAVSNLVVVPLPQDGTQEIDLVGGQSVNQVGDAIGDVVGYIRTPSLSPSPSPSVSPSLSPTPSVSPSPSPSFSPSPSSSPAYQTGDVNEDGIVDLGDFAALAIDYGKPMSETKYHNDDVDQDNSGVVDLGDVSKFIIIYRRIYNL